MVARLTALLLLAAVAWALAMPNRVAREVERDADHHADALGLPEVFDPPIRGRAALGIDPTPHRAALEQIEAILYRRGPAGRGDGEAVEDLASRLGVAMMEEGLAGRRAGAELLAFAGRTGARSDVGYVMPSLVTLRREWEALRGHVFAPAAFLRTAAPDLDAVQEPPPPAMDPRTPAALAQAADALHRLLQRGQRDVERLGEPVYDPDVPGRGDGGQIRAWYAWGERWRQDLHAALAPVRVLSPPPHPHREPLHDESLRALVEAHDALRRVPDGTGMWPTPFRASWESRFRHASAALARARETLAHTGDGEPPLRARR